MLRILLFAGTNIAVLIVLSVAMRLLGLDEYLTQSGTSMTGLLILSAIIGFAGSLISLFMSKSAAKRSMGVRIIENPTDKTEAWIVNTVRRFADEKGIGMPEVGIFDSPNPNAFATGARRDASLVAVSTGLLQAMKPQEVEAVIGHEIAHVSNGDMVTMTLLQGVLNTFVVFFSRVIGTVVDRAVFRIERGHGPGFFIVSMVAQVVLGVFATMIAMWFSRYREYRADKGGAELAGRENMINALAALARDHNDPLPDELAAFGVSGGAREIGLKDLFMSHPPIPKRIEALRNL